MIYVNQEARRLGSGLVDGYLLDLFGFQEYEAFSVKDFEENRGEIKPTGALSLAGVFQKGLASVTLHSVNYRRSRYNTPQIYDMTGSIDVKFHMFWSNPICDLRLGMLGPYQVPNFDEGRLSEATLLYKPATDEVFLWLVEPYGPSSTEREEKEAPSALEPQYAYA